jgi:putative membrane protein
MFALNHWLLVSWALAGSLLSSLLACIPALHVYSVAGLVLMILPRTARAVPPPHLAMFMLGMVVGYAVVGAIPSLFVGAPDESSVWIVLPGQRYLLQGRGYEAAILSGLGSVGGLLVLVLLAPFASRVLSPIRQVIQPHLHWLLGLVTLYLLLSEWPKESGRGHSALRRLWDAWKSLIAGLSTFLLSGLLGLIIAYRSPVPPDRSMQSLMPAFVGLFAVPWVLQNILSRTRVPRQHVCRSVDLSPGVIAHGVGAGVLGGLLAALFPVVTPGIGGLIAGHATAQRDDRAFILSQGSARAVYYVGALLFYWTPGLNLTRGGMAWMLSPTYRSHTSEEYWIAVAATAVCAALSFSLLPVLSRWAAALVGHVDYHWLSWGTLALLVVWVTGVTGWGGLLVTAAATGIGLIPILFHARRTNCMGVLLIPILLDMAGLAPLAAGWLGLR